MTAERCQVCTDVLTYNTDVIGGKLNLPPLWYDGRKLKHAHLACYRLVGAYGRVTVARLKVVE